MGIVGEKVNLFLYSVTKASIAIQSVCTAPCSLNLTTGAGEQSVPMHTTLYILEDSPVHIKKEGCLDVNARDSDPTVQK
jgi:hypothetical protein